MQVNRQAVQDNHAAVIQRDAERGQHFFHGTASGDIHCGDVPWRAGRQVLDVGGDHLDADLHAVILAQLFHDIAPPAAGLRGQDHLKISCK